MTALPARTFAAPVKPPSEVVRPGIYLSDSVELLLQNDGTFEVLELGGSRSARGTYKVEPGKLVFKTGAGDIGKTRFPVVCDLVGTFAGFAVRSARSQCRPFDGLSFRSAN